MKKNIIMIAESFFKKWDTQTETTIASDRSWGGARGFDGKLVMITPDEQTPNLRQVYMVTIEAVNLRKDEHPCEGYKRLLAEKEQEDEKTPGAGRKFR